MTKGCRARLGRILAALAGCLLVFCIVWECRSAFQWILPASPPPASSLARERIPVVFLVETCLGNPLADREMADLFETGRIEFDKDTSLQAIQAALKANDLRLAALLSRFLGYRDKVSEALCQSAPPTDLGYKVHWWRILFLCGSPECKRLFDENPPRTDNEVLNLANGLPAWDDPLNYEVLKDIFDLKFQRSGHVLSDSLNQVAASLGLVALGDRDAAQWLVKEMAVDKKYVLSQLRMRLGRGLEIRDQRILADLTQALMDQQAYAAVAKLATGSRYVPAIETLRQAGFPEATFEEVQRLFKPHENPVVLRWVLSSTLNSNRGWDLIAWGSHKQQLQETHDHFRGETQEQFAAFLDLHRGQTPRWNTDLLCFVFDGSSKTQRKNRDSHLFRVRRRDRMYGSGNASFVSGAFGSACHHAGLEPRKSLQNGILQDSRI